MKVKRSKNLKSGGRPDPISIQNWNGLVEVSVPNIWGGRNSLEFTKKEARRLASALLKYTESMK